jgi:hypothetical protein
MAWEYFSVSFLPPPSSQAITALRPSPSMAWEGAKLRSIANTKAMLTDPFSHNTIRKDVVVEELMIVDSVEEYCNIALVLFGSNLSLPPASVRLLLTLTQRKERLRECMIVVNLVA